MHDDRLDLAFAAHMPIRASNYHADNRWVARDKFLKTVINRDVNCVGCHNGAYSTTDDPLAATDGWDRTWPSSNVAPEGNLFDVHDGTTLIDGMFAPDASKEGAALLFATTGWWGATPKTLFDVQSDCFERKVGGSSTFPRTPGSGYRLASFAGVAPYSNVLDLTQEFLDVSQDLGDGGHLPLHHTQIRAYTAPAPPHPAQTNATDVTGTPGGTTLASRTSPTSVWSRSSSESTSPAGCSKPSGSGG